MLVKDFGFQSRFQHTISKNGLIAKAARPKYPHYPPSGAEAVLIGRKYDEVVKCATALRLGDRARRFCRVTIAMLVAPPHESNTGRVIGGKPGVAHEKIILKSTVRSYDGAFSSVPCAPSGPWVTYGQCEKSDQAAAISIGHHAAVRAMVRRLRR